MGSLELEQNLSQLLLKTVELPEKFSACAQMFVLQREDISFVKKEVGSFSGDPDIRLDTLIKLYIAFYLDAIPVQILENIRRQPDLFKKDDLAKEYLLAVAGIMYESKTLLLNNSETMIPYLMAYKEYLGEKNVEEISEDELVKQFTDVIETSIQTLINF